MTLTTGTRLGRYEIRTKLGEGGMGEVYLALDTQLDRLVALKILSAEVARDQQRLYRFMQEARAASALAHPNVAHIYEIGEIEGMHFIAMEYVEGVALDKKVAGQPINIAEILDIGIQVADALDEAHAKGITHRDIKSSNIMITPRGRVKVLDFGLAKLSSPQAVTDRTSGSEIATRVKTTPGVVMGTVNYMSPEQALGREVDHRTDIFSFGVVLYEMATGRLPFTGDTVSETIDRIAHAQPEAIVRLNYNVPAELEVIIKKALRKERDERYQTIHDALVDLKELRRDHDMASGLERSAPPPSRSGELATQMSVHPSARAASIPPAPPTVSVPLAQPTSSAEYIVNEIKRHRIGIGIATTIVLFAVIAGGFLVYKLATSNKTTGSPAIKFTRLTTGGRVGNELIIGGTNISPDGKWVVFVTSEKGLYSWYVRQISTNSLVRIAGPAEETTGGGTAFSPDGEFVYFPKGDKTTPDGALFKVPVLGGTPQKILEGIWGPVTFSPDGKQIAYVRLFPSTGESWLVIANADGSGTPRTISKRNLPEYYSRFGPSWSPDGKRIAVGAQSIPEVSNATVVEVPVEGGSEHAVTKPQWSNVSRVHWIKDGSGLVFAADSFLNSTGSQIWFVSYPDGVAHRITNDLNGYGHYSLGLTADSNTIVTVQTDYTNAIWLAPVNEDSSKAHQISNGKYEGSLSLDAATEGRIVYLDSIGNANEIGLMKADGTDKKQLTSDGAIKLSASVSPDGRYILFASNRSGAFSIWRLDLDGNNQKQLTNNETFAVNAVASPDGKWVVYQSLRDGKWQLWKIPIDGGDATSLTDKQCVTPVISPDGKTVACLSPDEKAGFKWQLIIAPFDRGPITKVLEFPATANQLLEWTRDGRSIAYVDASGDAQNIFAQPIDGGQRKQLTNFKTDGLAAFNFTRDGKQLILGRGPQTNDVVLIKDFR